MCDRRDCAAPSGARWRCLGRRGGGPDAEVLASGGAEIAIVQPIVVLGVSGVELVGPLPDELQNKTDFVFMAGVGANAKDAATAQAFIRHLFIRHLLTAESARVIKAKGIEPGSTR